MIVLTQEEDEVRKGLREPREMVTPALRQSLTKQGVWEVRVCVVNDDIQETGGLRTVFCADCL